MILKRKIFLLVVVALVAIGLSLNFTPSAEAAVCTYSGTGGITGSSCAVTGGSGQNCTALGLNWFYRSACVSDATLQSESQACFSNRRQFDGVSGCTSSCRVAGEVLCGSACQAPAPTAFNDSNANFSACNGAFQSCDSGYERINGAGNCVERCPEGAVRIADGSCLTLESVSNRVGDLEGISLCEFDQGGRYVQRNSTTTPRAICLESFDPTSLNDRLGVIELQLSALSDVLGTLVSSDLLNDLLDAILNGDIAGLAERLAALQDALDDLANSVVGRALVADTLSLTCEENGQVLQFTGGAWVCGDGTAAAPAVFVGFTNPIVNTARVGAGYQTANSYCSSGPWASGNWEASHICSAQEIISSYASGVLGAGDIFTGSAWVNNGPPAYLDTLVNDCGGWTVNTASRYGATWNFTSNAGFIQTCGADLRFACCR